jgi:tRNA pseudouridine38-40 synthase
MKLLLKISYLGSAYCGYQVQNNGVTVQGVMNKATEAVFGFPCDIVGCSRTDSGVHANEFYLTVAQKGMNSLVCSIPVEKIPTALNCRLPSDVSVLEATTVSDEFHARYDVKYKEYVYKIWNGSQKNPFLSDRALFPHAPVSEEGIARMDLGAKQLVGTHDFASYMATGSKIKDTVRTVYYADVKREGDTVVFRVAADGFLYNMVRIMAGTLLEVARGGLSPEAVARVTEAKDRRAAGATAPAHGLYLNRVSYQPFESETEKN